MPELDSTPPLVLIASDQEWSGRSLETIIGPRGYAVVRAHTGQQVLQTIAERWPFASSTRGSSAKGPDG